MSNVNSERTMPQAEPGQHSGIGFREFVALMAALMATNALSVDAMLPALTTIGADLHVATANQVQWIITFYLIGFGIAQLIYGPLADRFGRKPVLLIGLALYIACCLVTAVAPNLQIMLAARAAQGIGAAASRVLVTAIIRDCYSGRQMARILSLVFIVFLAVPIAAPSIGQLIMLIAPWRWIFGATAAFAIVVTLWVIGRLPETLHRGDRMPIAFGRITDALGLICTNRVAVGYTVATALMTGGMFGFINSSQQIFAEVFRAPRLFPLVFAVAASGMAISALLNARIVVRLGARRVSHTALCLFIGWALAHVAIALCGLETIWTFAVCQAGMMFFFGMVPSNFSATSMEPLGHVAGTASSVQGFVTLLGGGLLGAAVGQAYNGTVMPMLFSFVAVGAAALLVIVITERGRLFPSAPPGSTHALADPITQAADSLLS